MPDAVVLQADGAARVRGTDGWRDRPPLLQKLLILQQPFVGRGEHVVGARPDLWAVCLVDIDLATAACVISKPPREQLLVASSV